jgi:hypothetical protein
MKLIYLALGGLLMLLLPACSSPSHAADPPPASTSPSTTVPAGSYAIPRVITVAYVNSVLKALNHVYGNAERIEKQDDAVTGSVVADLRSIYSEPQLDTELQIFHQALAGPLSQVKEDPGDRVFVVTDLKSYNSACVAAIVQASYAEVDQLSSSSKVVSVLLESNETQAERDSLNPTPWAIAYEEQRPSPKSCET